MYKEYICKCGEHLSLAEAKLDFESQNYLAVQAFCPNCHFQTAFYIELADLEEYLLENEVAIYTMGGTPGKFLEKEKGTAKFNYETIPGMTLEDFANFWNNCPPRKWSVCMGKLFVSQEDCCKCRLEWLKEEIKEK